MGSAAALSAAQPTPPPDLSALAARARVDGQLVSWCRGQFHPGQAHGYAAALSAATGGGRYLVLDGNATVVELARFNGAPDLACYTPAEARKLDASIRKSDTISGQVTPLFATTVVCAFVDNTSALCWQYSTAARAFVKVGEWET